MIVELVTFNSPAGWDRARVLEDAKTVVPKWAANRDLVRKHFLLGIGETSGTGAGLYIWPSIDAAKTAHNDEWREGIRKRTGGYPSIRYFDLLLLVDNERGAVTEYPPTARRASSKPSDCARIHSMSDTGWLWAVFTLVAAAAQTARNAMQRELTASLGTAGATHVRFLFGFPFALVFLATLLLVTGGTLPRPPLAFWPWVVGGAGAQVAATALMLAAMGERSFVVAIAYIKTEPVQVALFGLIFLGDALNAGMVAAILIATAGVLVMSLKPGDAAVDLVAFDFAGPERRRDVRAVGDRLSRRDPEPRSAGFCHDRDLHAGRRPAVADGGFLSVAALAGA